ncbi:hypothetical protein ACTQ49_07320 [Luteococcus sp. Sow4_B9]|uniref:hypothetical protein n=1 Tax=Luteococcus sp. Sow4_B9 TaxID=3438792 RepID=UPI003F9CE28C
MRPADGHFAEVFSEALRNRKLTLQRVHARLVAAGTPVSEATLSYWQTGRSTPRRTSSLRVLAELERILEIQPGSLVAAIDGRTFAQWDLTRVLPEPELVDAALSDLGLRDCRQYRGISVDDDVRIGADRTEKEVVSHVIIRADVVAIDRIPLIFQQEEGADGIPGVEAVAGCRIGRQVELPEIRMVVSEALFPRRLEPGDAHHFKYRVEWAPTTTPSFRWERSLANDHRQVVTSVTFAGEPPRTIHGYHLPSMDVSPEEPWPEDQLPGVPLQLVEGQVQYLTLDAPLGLHGVTWVW